MDYGRLQEKKTAYQIAKKTYGEAFAAMEREFEIRYAYESNTLDGNSGRGKSYLLSQGDNVLPAPPNAREKLRGSGFTLYIFTHDEVRRIFDAADK